MRSRDHDCSILSSSSLQDVLCRRASPRRPPPPAGTDQYRPLPAPRDEVTTIALLGATGMVGRYLLEAALDRGFRVRALARTPAKLDAYESDLPLLRYGEDVEFTTQSLPGETFHGRISFIDPVLNSSTRTVNLRVNVDNPGARLKPGKAGCASLAAAPV